MAIKFFKSLLALTNEKQVIHEIVRIDPIPMCVPLISKCKGKLSKLNMLDSAVFEFVNQYAMALYELVGMKLWEQTVERHRKDFDWLSKNMLKKWFWPVDRNKKQQQQSPQQP